jgi:hypothetical protein
MRLTNTFTGKKDGIRARRRVARLNLPPYGYLYATTAPSRPPRGYSPLDLALEGPRCPRQDDLGNWDHWLEGSSGHHRVVRYKVGGAGLCRQV